MENVRILKTILPLVAIFFIFTPIKAYSPNTTHHGLTSEIIKFYEYYYPENKFTNEEKEWIKNGSVDEDHDIRPMNHFYDPINNQGLWGFSSSKDWVNDTLSQANRSKDYVSNTSNFAQTLFSSETDFSWDRAIYEYAYGDKRRAMEALGHVLHLVEDATVPDHTRGDPHPPYYDEVFGQASPYEGWTSQFKESNMVAFDELLKANIKPVIYSNLYTYFDKMASFSNNSFFSKDSINNYKLPIATQSKFIMLSDGVNYEFGFNNDYLLSRIRRTFNKNSGKMVTDLFVEDLDNLIMSDYWNILSKEAVKNGAGVVKLFFDEVAKEKETKILYNKNLSWVSKQIKNITNYFTNTFSNAFSSNQNIASPLAGLNSLEDSAGNNILENEPNDVLEPEVQIDINENNNLPIIPTPEEVMQIITPAIIAPFVAPVINQNQNPSGLGVPYIGFGGGGGGNPSAVEEDASEESVTSVPEEKVIEKPVFSIISPEDLNSTFTNNKIRFSGTSTPSAVIKTNRDIETKSSETGEWSMDLDFEEGENSVSFWAEKDEQKSEVKNVNLNVDTIAPDLTFEISECSDSLVTSQCFLSGIETLSISWGSLQVSDFDTDWNGVESKTSATSTIYNIATEGLYSFKVSVADEAGNTTTKEIKVERFDMPIVINEIAWMGTQSNAGHEWIELYNRSDKNISLSSLVIKKTINSFTTPLFGEIPAKGYYLLERGTDGAVRDVPADLIYEASGLSLLSNGGDQLILERNGAVIDKTPPRGADGCLKWCAGSGGNNFTPAYSMERVDPDIEGKLPSNWDSAVGEFIQNGVSENGQIIKGTPRSDNSARHLISTNDFLFVDKTLTTKNSPYLVTRFGFTIEKDAVLTLEKGVVIKIVSPNEPSLYVKGKIVANGTTDEPVVITSYKDDEYGGDLDGLVCDESSGENCPSAGDWKQIFVYDTGGLDFKNTIVRFGGRYFSNTQMKSMIAVNGADINFENLTISDSLDSGLYIKNGDLVFNGGKIMNTNNVAGLLFSGTGVVNIGGILFENNLLDIRVDGTGYDFNCSDCAQDLKTIPADLLSI